MGLLRCAPWWILYLLADQPFVPGVERRRGWLLAVPGARRSSGAGSRHFTARRRRRVRSVSRGVGESAGQAGLLVPAHARCPDGPADRGVLEQAELAEQQRLTKDDHQKPDVGRIADVAVEPRHHQVLGRCQRHRSTARHGELDEHGHYRDESGADQEYPHRPRHDPVRQRPVKLPARDPPGDQHHERTGHRHEPRRTADRGGC
jgi:hypothetical protein